MEVNEVSKLLYHRRCPPYTAAGRLCSSWFSRRVRYRRIAGEAVGCEQGVTKRCRLSWLTNSALVSTIAGGGAGGWRISANEYSCAHGAQMNFGDLTPYLTYGCEDRILRRRFLDPAVFVREGTYAFTQKRELESPLY